MRFSSVCLHIFQYVKDGVKLDSDVLKSEPDDQYLFTNLNYTRIFYSYTPSRSSCPALFRLWNLKTIKIKIELFLYPAFLAYLRFLPWEIGFHQPSQHDSAPCRNTSPTSRRTCIHLRPPGCTERENLANIVNHG